MEKTAPVIAVIGLGYVGLPLAVAFGDKFKTIGFDLNVKRVAALKAGTDDTGEVSSEKLTGSQHLELTADTALLADVTHFIVAVPTPVTSSKQPDLTPLLGASRTVGQHLKKGDLVVFESTVYPGCTRNDCVPALEAASGLTFGQDFEVGYSPERINPGDKKHNLQSIVKVTSGSTKSAAQEIDDLYGAIIDAGTYSASSIEVAEAAKIIENVQRDINIALVNELAILFDRLNIDTLEVLEAAGTKWNFLPFRPGLVGGHCIGVDPYYLTHRARDVDYFPEMILAGRRINEEMGNYVGGRIMTTMMKRGLPVVGCKILILGLTFKEDCPDLRNTRVVDVISHLQEHNAHIDVHDPWVTDDSDISEFDFPIVPEPKAEDYDAVILAVGHRQFKDAGPEWARSLLKEGGVLFDVKGLYDADAVDARL